MIKIFSKKKCTIYGAIPVRCNNLSKNERSLNNCSRARQKGGVRKREEPKETRWRSNSGRR